MGFLATISGNDEIFQSSNKNTAGSGSIQAVEKHFSCRD
jgi:hypothetical protein